MGSTKQRNYLKTTVLYFELRLSYDRNTLSSLDTQDSIHSVELQHFTWLDI